MFRPLSYSCSYRRPHRRGTSFILIVVVMLSLFSAVGTAYALFAMREAKLALMRKEEQGGGTSAQLQAPNPDGTVNKFFNSLLLDDYYDNPADPTYAHLFNAMRGHSIGRSMYGYNASLINANPYLTTPWNGVGIFHEDIGGAYGDRAYQINYTLMSLGSTPRLLDPEYTGTRAIGSDGKPVALDTTTRTYIGKNAGYSYADLKDFFLAAYSPATGEVLVPSFHRDWLTGGPNSLSPANTAFWGDPKNKLKTLRPWPADHPQFPRVPANQDGTYTGDVQNLPGGVGPQKNDSIWIDIGAPVITLPGNRRVKPLVAALILPLNGYLDANSHGNLYFSNAHKSSQGFGSWEVNLNALLGTEGPGLIQLANKGRGENAFTRLSTTQPPPVVPVSRRFDPFNSSPLALYGAVAWNNTIVQRPTYTYTSTLDDLHGMPKFNLFQSDNALASAHPSGFNPMEWSSAESGFNRTYPISDIKRLLGRYADTRDAYKQSDLAARAPNSLLGSDSFGFILAPQRDTPNTYRLDPSHSTRGLITTRSYELDRPKVMPMFTASTLLTYDPTTNPKPTPAVVSAYPIPGVEPGSITDFFSKTQWTNIRAAIGSVNLNRRLRDYRPDAGLNLPLSSTNIKTGTDLTEAENDRVNLANDIFKRLVVAVGAAAYVNPTTGALASTGNGLPTNTSPYTITTPGGNVTVTREQYNALRYLAQLSVNIVDYIDNDDISTVFAWNGGGGGNLSDDATIADRVVFGVEKPRLVINEAYGELTNDPNDPVNGKITDPVNMTRENPQKPFQARFWVELLNPSSDLSINKTVTTGPLGDGSVPLDAYQIQISRAERGAVTAVPAGQTGNLVNYLGLPQNVRGRLGVPGAGELLPDAKFPLAPALPPGLKTLAPNDGKYSGTAGAPAQGVILVGPNVAKKMDTDPPMATAEEFAPTGGVWANFIPARVPDSTQDPANGNRPKDDATLSATMGYVFNLPPAPNDTIAAFSDKEFKRHVILLQRRANPYLLTASETTNPYITVDVMDYVPAFDAVHRGKTDGPNREARSGTKPSGYDPVTERFSVGKVQPYAGHSITKADPAPGAGKYNEYAFPNSMVLKQEVDNSAAPAQPSHSFGRHNGKGPSAIPASFPAVAGAGAPTLSDTLMTPFDWLVHMDRPLVNQLELLQVRDSAPHRVTDQFLNVNPNYPAAGVSYDNGYVRWLDDGFSRALEYLAVRSFTDGVPHGGRVPGRINVNALNDKRVLQALVDPQESNLFDQTYIDRDVWGGAGSGWINSRTPVGLASTASPTVPQVNRTQAPSPSVYDIGATTPPPHVTQIDRPFLPLGAAEVRPTAADPTAMLFGAGVGIDHTILRRGLSSSNLPAPGQYPNLFTVTPPGLNSPNSQPAGPAYFRSEPARKIMNNITTVNHQYIVFLTIGYFDVVDYLTVTPGVPAIPKLGPETFITIPGDMRQKFIAVVDMSNMGLDPINKTQATEVPFFTSLEDATVTTGPGATLKIHYSRFFTDTSTGQNHLFVMADGEEVEIIPGQTHLSVGYGLGEQIPASVAGIDGPGLVRVTREDGIGSWSPAPQPGTCVSNIRPGFAGPQGDFDYTAPKYKGVLPYVERLK